MKQNANKLQDKAHACAYLILSLSIIFWGIILSCQLVYKLYTVLYHIPISFYKKKRKNNCF